MCIFGEHYLTENVGFINSCEWKRISLEAERQFSVGYEKKILITMTALVLVILKHSLQWRGEFHLYLRPVPVQYQYLLIPLLDDF